MDRANKESSPSFTVDLFGPKDSSSKSSNSSAGFFGSIFGPQSSMVPGIPPDSGHAQYETTTDYKSVKGNSNPMKKEINSSYNNGKSVEPCYYNSSIYYGGQEIYSPTNRNTPPQNISSRKMETMSIKMKAILVVPPEEIGGKDLSIIEDLN